MSQPQAAATSTGASTATPASAPTRQCSVSTLVIPQVRCTCGAPLSGLFVVFRPSRGQDANVEALAKCIEEALKGGSNAGQPVLLGDRVFYLAKTDERGFLSTVEEGPDAHKLVLGAKYECVFVHHPDVNVARALRDELNKGRAPTLLREIAVTRTPIQKYHKKSQLDLLKVDAEKDLLHIGGAKRYGGLVLFASMPIASCEFSRPHVTRLQTDLGSLRYVVGGPSSHPEERRMGVLRPYAPPALTASLPGDEAGEPLRGDFSIQTMAAVYAFQEDARGEGDGLVALKKSPLGEGNKERPWDYLDVDEAKQTLSTKPAKKDGVVEATTADAIAEALQKNLRRAGDIMVPVPATSSDKNADYWLRSDAALAVRAWDELVRAFGGKQAKIGVCAYRSIYNAIAAAPAGKATKSPHKTGRAADMFNHRYEPVPAEFPVIRERAILDDGRDVWTLWMPCPTKLPEEGMSPADVAALEVGLEAQKATLVDKLKKLTKAEYEGHANQPLRSAAAKILDDASSRDAVSFFKLYVQNRVAKWNYAPNETGGAADPVASPPSANGGWLNVTKLAEAAEFHRISCGAQWKARHPKAKIEGKNATQLLSKLASAKAKGRTDFTLKSLPERPVLLARVDMTALAAWQRGGRALAAKKKTGVALKGLTLLWNPSAEEKAVLDPLKAVLGEVKRVQVTLTDPTGKADPDAKWMTAAEAQAALETAYKALIANPPTKKTDGSRGSSKACKAIYSFKPDVLDGDAPPIDPVAIDPSDVAIVPLPDTSATARCQEWWHFQVSGTSWFADMRKLGWRRNLLLGAPLPECYGRPGIGYSEKD